MARCGYQWVTRTQLCDAPTGDSGEGFRLRLVQLIKDTGTYEMRQMVYLGFRVVLDGKKS